MLSLITILLLSVLALGLESQAVSSGKLVQDYSTSTVEFLPEITVEAQGGILNFSGIIPLVSTTSVFLEPTIAPPRPFSNKTFEGNGSVASSQGSIQPTATGSFLTFNHSLPPYAPTASLVLFTSSASRDTRLYLSEAALVFFLGAMQM
jgi:hypothetical protein